MLHWLCQHNALHPNQVALYEEDKSWTFHQIFETVSSYQSALLEQLDTDIQRVAVWSSNSAHFYFTILSLWGLEKEIVFLNTHLTMSEIDYQLKDSDTNCLIFCEDAPHLDQLASCETIMFLEPNVEIGIRDTNHKTIYPDRGCIASIMYTSGTTGYPKGVLQTFSNHQASSLATQKHMRISQSDIWVCTVPMFHISGLSIVMRHLILGCSIRIERKFDASKINHYFLNRHATVISLVNTMLKQLYPLIPDEGYGKEVKGFLIGGSSVETDLLIQSIQKKIPIIQSFGMTETCSQVIALSPIDSLSKVGSSGKPLFDVDVKIINNNSICQANEVGEITIHSPAISKQYVHSEVCDKRFWTLDGYFKTGDMGYLDEDGFLYVVTRISDLIISGGENIYPPEVERCLLKLEGIQEVAVVGKEDGLWGHVPCAYIVSNLVYDFNHIQAHCEKYLAKYKIPKCIYYVDDLPKTASGKVIKRKLLNL